VKVDVVMASITEDKLVTSAQNIPVVADDILENVDKESYDCLILPGGPGHTNLKTSAIFELIKKYASEDKYIAAICAAPSIIGELGLLNGKKATCFPGYEDSLKGAIVVPDKACMDGKFITGKGMGASIEFGLKVVEALLGENTANTLAFSIQMN